MSQSEIVKDFLIESYENLDRLDRDLVGLEKNPKDAEAMAGVFRTIHTIKGTCGFLGFGKLEKVAHVGENLLTLLRDGQFILNPERTTALLEMVDAIRQMLKEIESTGQDGEIDYPELREKLTLLQNSSAGIPGWLPGQTRNRLRSLRVNARQKRKTTKSNLLGKKIRLRSRNWLCWRRFRLPSRCERKVTNHRENPPAKRLAEYWLSADWRSPRVSPWRCKSRKRATAGVSARFWSRSVWLNKKTSW